jgi:hypothetical protein
MLPLPCCLLISLTCCRYCLVCDCLLPLAPVGGQLSMSRVSLNCTPANDCLHAGQHGLHSGGGMQAPDTSGGRAAERPLPLRSSSVFAPGAAFRSKRPMAAC